jgi:serine protease Do
MKAFLVPLLFLGASLAADTPDRGIVSITGTTGESARGGGLGFIVEKEGFILTVYDHLVHPGDGRFFEKFEVRSGERTYPAEIIGVEPTINLAILKLETTDTFTPVVPAVKRDVTPGMPVQAASFGGKELALIDGTVVAQNTKQCYQHSLASTMFRARITIPPGSKGGPVFHSDTGEVAAIFTGFKPLPEPGHSEVEGETHLLPIELCFNIYESLKTKRSFQSPWTGFSVRALEPAETAFFPTARMHHGGVAVEGVWENSPASRMGIREGDILVQFGFNRILSVADFQKWLYMHGVGHKVKLILLRNGTDYLMSDYVIEERPASAKPR